jgi:hypothetical protein
MKNANQAKLLQNQSKPFQRLKYIQQVYGYIQCILCYKKFISKLFF